MIEIARETAPVVGDPHRNPALATGADFEVDPGRVTVGHGILNQVREYTFESARVCQHDRVAALHDPQIGPMTTQLVDTTPETDGFKKELAARQVHQKQRVL